ncbi:MAG: penicillin-binding protein activator [bacterium]
MKKILYIIIAVIVVGGVIWFALSNGKLQKTNGPIKIGSILPLTGDFAFFGGEILRGEQIALDEAQKNGTNIQLISEDDKSQPTGSVNSANKLTQIDKVKAVITATLQEVKPMTSIFNDGLIPLLATWDSNDYIKNAGKNIFTIGFSTEAAGKKMADYAYNTLGLRNVAVVNALDEWSSLVASAFTKEFTSLGGKIVLTEQVSPSQKEFRTQIAKIKDIKADGVYAPLLPTTIGPLLKQMKDLGLNKPFMTGDSFSADELATANGGAEGIYFTNLYADNTKALDAKYLAKYGQAPGASVFVSFGYDGMRTVLEAVKISQEKNISVSDAMRQVNIAGTDSQINMNGGQYSEKFEKLYQVRGSDFVEIK